MENGYLGPRCWTTGVVHGNSTTCVATAQSQLAEVRSRGPCITGDALSEAHERTRIVRSERESVRVRSVFTVSRGDRPETGSHRLNVPSEEGTNERNDYIARL